MFDKRFRLQQVERHTIRRREHALPEFFLHDVALRFEVRIVNIQSR